MLSQALIWLHRSLFFQTVVKGTLFARWFNAIFIFFGTWGNTVEDGEREGKGREILWGGWDFVLMVFVPNTRPTFFAWFYKLWLPCIFFQTLQ